MAIRKAQIALSLALVSVAELPAQTARESIMWGSPSNGLRIGIAAVSPTVPSERAGFVISLQNMGTNDFVLNLGSMLANGRVMFPDAVRIVLTTADGASRELTFIDRRYPAIAGRIDDFIVSLRGAATYDLPVTLDQYWNVDTKDYLVKLKPGRHRIAARFEGRGATHVNGDMPGVKLLNFWRGPVESGVLQFDVP
jgi:hypothetical protein